MEIKLFEIRDRQTFIAAMAIRLDSRTEAERWLLARSGFGLMPSDQREYVVVVKLGDRMEATYDPFSWPAGGRTMGHAHFYIKASWNDLSSGDVIDVEYLLGETKSPKRSEAAEGIPA